jgi:hypothetical protein
MNRILSPMPIGRRTLKNKGETPHQPSLAPSGIHDTCQTDHDLAAVIDAWDRLPKAVRAGIVAMVRAAGGGR